jgi:hypothetical protein
MRRQFPHIDINYDWFQYVAQYINFNLNLIYTGNFVYIFNIVIYILQKYAVYLVKKSRH